MFGFSEKKEGLMSYHVEINNNMDDEVVSKLYRIHKKVYVRKGIGKPFQEWRKDFYNTYHNIVQKNTLLFASSKNIGDIDGYLIITAPLQIHNHSWSKILEGGISSTTNQLTNFITMFKYLFRYGDSHGTNFFSETGPSFKSLIRILYGLEFSHTNEITDAIELMSTFLGGASFTFSRIADHLVIKRKTIIYNDYTGFILERKTTMKKEEYLIESFNNEMKS